MLILSILNFLAVWYNALCTCYDKFVTRSSSVTSRPPCWLLLLHAFSYGGKKQRFFRSVIKHCSLGKVINGNLSDCNVQLIEQWMLDQRPCQLGILLTRVQSSIQTVYVNNTSIRKHIISLIFQCCTCIPLLFNAPNIQVWPIPGVTVVISCRISPILPFPAEYQFISSSSLIWNSCDLVVRVLWRFCHSPWETWLQNQHVKHAVDHTILHGFWSAQFKSTNVFRHSKLRIFIWNLAWLYRNDHTEY